MTPARLSWLTARHSVRQTMDGPNQDPGVTPSSAACRNMLWMENGAPDEMEAALLVQCASPKSKISHRHD